MLGIDVPDRFACFQRQKGDPLCFGRTGGTTIKIEDNDGKACNKCSISEVSCVIDSELYRRTNFKPLLRCIIMR